MLNFLDEITLTERAVRLWSKAVAAANPRSLAQADADGGIPDEDAEPLADGRLRIHVTHPRIGVLCELIVEAKDWARTRRPQ